MARSRKATGAGLRQASARLREGRSRAAAGAWRDLLSTRRGVPPAAQGEPAHVRGREGALVDNLLLLAIGAVGWGLSLATDRLFARRVSWPMGALHVDLPAVPVVIGLFALLAGIGFAAARGSEAGVAVPVLEEASTLLAGATRARGASAYRADSATWAWPALRADRRAGAIGRMGLADAVRVRDRGAGPGAARLVPALQWFELDQWWSRPAATACSALANQARLATFAPCALLLLRSAIAATCCLWLTGCITAPRASAPRRFG